MTIIIIGASFTLIWLVTIIIIVRCINKLRNDLSGKSLNKENQPEKDKDIPGEKTYKPFENIVNYDPSFLITTLYNEHPQVIALILAHMEPHKASIVLQNFFYELQSDVAQRIAFMDRVSHETTREIEQVLEKRFSAMSNEGYSSAGGVECIVEILNNVDYASERRLIETFEDKDPELAEEIKKRMFKFEDIVILDDRVIQKIIHKMDSKELARAIKTAAPEVQDKIFKNLSKRAAKTLKLDIEYMGPLRLSDMNESKQKILSIIKYLEDTGEIKITRNSESALFV